MDRSDNNCPAVLQNDSKVRRVWNLLGKMIRKEGVEPQVSAMFCLALVQSVLYFVAETWVLSEVMSRKI